MLSIVEASCFLITQRGCPISIHARVIAYGGGASIKPQCRNARYHYMWWFRLSSTTLRLLLGQPCLFGQTNEKLVFNYFCSLVCVCIVPFTFECVSLVNIYIYRTLLLVTNWLCNIRLCCLITNISCWNLNRFNLICCFEICCFNLSVVNVYYKSTIVRCILLFSIFINSKLAVLINIKCHCKITVCIYSRGTNICGIKFNIYFFSSTI